MTPLRKELDIMGGKAGVASRDGAGRDDPKHRVAFVGKPLALDCRPSIREYIDGERKGAPSVQTLVRGHYKRQVVGVSRSGRKVIWVQPYWRGPEDAPILAHPYRVGPAAPATPQSSEE